MPDVLGGIRAAESFLLGAQTREGLWPDFELEPGASEAWTTAVAAFALSLPPVGPASVPALARAADTLHDLLTGAGWGYNRRTAADADSTAWTVRFLAQVDDLRGIDAIHLLQGFLDPDGAAHTFRGAQYGAWSGAHDDVSPVVGLALLALEGPQGLTERVRSNAIRKAETDPRWRSFWWTTDAYATALSLEFLAESGGVPRTIVERTRTTLAGALSSSAFESAHLLMCASRVDPGSAPTFASKLLSTQCLDGSWPTSVVLLVPSQRGLRITEAHGDAKRILTTSTALLSLKHFLRLCELTGSGFRR